MKMRTIQAYIIDLALRTARVARELLIIMLPVMLLVKLLEEWGFTESFSDFLAPAMALVGLPSEASIVVSIAMLTNLYAGIGATIVVMESLSMSVAEVSILGSMMLFCHALPVEQAVVKRAGASFFVTSGLRIFAAFSYGALCHYFFSTFDLLQDPANSVLVLDASGDGGWGDWFVSILMTIAVTCGIILALLVLLDGLKKIGVIDWLVGKLAPVLTRLGMNAELTPLTIIGLLLGLSYGGGMIIVEAKSKNYSAKDLFGVLLCLSLVHSLIEDTLLVLALGSSVWIVLVWRLLFAMCLLVLSIKIYELLMTSKERDSGA